MNLIKEIYLRNRLLATAGTINLVAALLMTLYAFVNTTEVLGINSMIKPIKFAISIWVYSWTLAYLLFYLNDQKRVRNFSILSVIVMAFENLVIIIQAFRGKLSHFNQTEIVGGILYALMGIMIMIITIATLIIAIRFIRQKTYAINSTFALSIKIGLIFFVIFSFMGGYMSAINSHNVGGQIGEAGLPFLNWSTIFGDLRVAHFFGLHSLQLIPLFGYFISKNSNNGSKTKSLVWLFSILYFAFVSFTLWQALKGMPFLG
jgi:hypothetical protein